MGERKTGPIEKGCVFKWYDGAYSGLDDVHTNSKTHIGTVVIPAAWGMAEYLGKSGKELLEAVICGYEVMARIGMGFGVPATGIRDGTQQEQREALELQPLVGNF